MKIDGNIANELFRAFNIQRWNDRPRPMDLYEMDKHAHKMMIAYCLGKYEESEGREIEWERLIRHSVFELFRRIVTSDIKSPILDQIRKNKQVYHQLNEYVYRQLQPKFAGTSLEEPLRDYLFAKQEGEGDLTDRVISAAHIYASYLEFQSIFPVNPTYYQNIKIQTELSNTLNKYRDLVGIRKLINRLSVSNFIDLCGQLRYQIRWAQTPRVPQTTVLGHSMMVAVLSYFMTVDLPHCPKRIFNNFFCGIFHDLPEVVTRDIISPVKRASNELEDLISSIERELGEQEIFPLIESDWVSEIKYFTQNEFANKYTENGETILAQGIDDITTNYNKDRFSPLDGEIVRAADRFSAFLEAWNSCVAGIKSDEFLAALDKIKKEHIDKSRSPIDFASMFDDFDIDSLK